MPLPEWAWPASMVARLGSVTEPYGVPVKKLMLSEISWSLELAMDSMSELKVVVALPLVCSALINVLMIAVAFSPVKQCRCQSSKSPSGLGGAGVATTAEATASAKRIALNCILDRAESNGKNQRK